MKSVILSIALMASAVAAQTTSACGADYIVETCLASEQAKFAACDTNDWGCKCAAYEAILTCYNNCPNDTRRPSEEGQKQIFCGYASQYPSKTSKAVSGTAGAAATTTGAAAGAATTNGAVATTSSGSGTGSAASPSKTGGAADLAIHAGGVFAAIAGVVAAAL